MMKTDEIRKNYLEFFKSKGHSLVASDSLVPQNDPTLLFTGAGMNQFKEYFLGLKKDLKRATTSQKCLRTGDLEQVGKTAYHHSFFEMLGNFSFGDYFKEEAITWAWEFLTQKMKIPVERLRISVHTSDEEAYRIWRDKIKIREDWIYKLGDDSNFWPANAPQDGPNGPCGPCSEIYFDQAADPQTPGTLEDKRFAEIWNLVFTQFDRRDGGKLEPLANKNIDTGMGLERLACVLQGKKSNYEIDLFQPILHEIASVLHVKAGSENQNVLNAIADHARAVVFCILDGVIPSNEGRGYVVRKLIRRSLWNAHQIVPAKHLDEAFLYKLVPVIGQVMGTAYPELKDAEKSIAVALKGEEDRFLDTLETGLRILNERILRFRKTNELTLPGEIVFELYDTYGFPDELTRMIAQAQNFKIDQKGFDKLMDEQRQRAKQASQISGSIFSSTELEKKLLALPATRFLGYDALTGKGKLLLSEIHNGEGVVVLDQTPFYAESGGQVGDHGVLEASSVRALVLDTQKKDQVFLHYVKIERGQFDPGALVDALVDQKRREKTMRNHTATHLLHAALREILGSQVRQLGSLVSPDKLRFDFSYGQPLTSEQIRIIEDRVNEEILKDTDVSKQEKPIEEARKEGAIAFFGEKYGEKVRVVDVPGFSKEFCGGTHCSRTGQIGAFLIVSESSIASGTRRIEALTGEGALEYARTLRLQINKLAQDLRTMPAQIGEKVNKLQDSVKQLEKQIQKGGAASVNPEKLLAEAKPAGAYHLASYQEKGIPVEQLRYVSDILRDKGKKCVYLLATESEEKIHFLLGMSHDLHKSALDLREVMKELGPVLGATGGGRKELVQGGAPNKGQLQSQWSEVVDKAVSIISVKG